MVSLQHYSHAVHLLMQEKERKEKKLREDNKKLEKLKGRLKTKLDAFVRGRQVKIRELSSAFLKQAVVVDGEKRKLQYLRAKLEQAKREGFPKKGV